ncbi:MAG: hypothetical protein NTY19_37870 [Planctomycetota bacterium]|nr:hypothetical protein [Planctomycetota bacterium]
MPKSLTPLVPVSDIQRAGPLERTQLRYLDALKNGGLPLFLDRPQR